MVRPRTDPGGRPPARERAMTFQLFTFATSGIPSR